MTKEQKKHIAVFRKAAELIVLEEESFSCCAIEDVSGGDLSTLSIYESIYQEDSGRGVNQTWWVKIAIVGDEIEHLSWEEMNEARIFALLFAAEMVRTDSLP